MPELLKPFLFFLNTPDLTKLFTLYLDICSANEYSQRSQFHAKILKCRELIFREADVVSCPSRDVTLPIKAIIPRTKIRCSEFRANLEKMGLEIVSGEETTTATLQECLQYTCTAKLAPSWNIVENILVQEMDIFVSHQEITLCLQPTCIKLPMMKVEQYIKPEQFMSSYIQLEEKCYVLPSMKQATVTAITKNPQTTGAFKNYFEIQKHWKDMYGYLLPNLPEESIKYFNVVFRIPNATPYTYPQFCVRPYKMTQVPRVDPKTTLSSFIKDFGKRVGNVCGEKCKLIEGRPSFTNLVLQPAVNISQDLKPRPGTTYGMKTNISYRKDLNFASIPSNKVKGNNQNPISNDISTFSHSNFKAINATNNSLNSNIIRSEINLKDSTFHKMNERLTENASKEVSMQSKILQSAHKEESDKKYAPCFASKQPKTGSLCAKSTNQTNRFAPKFHPMKSNASGAPLLTKTSSTDSETRGQNSAKAKQLSKCSEKLPSTKIGIETTKISEACDTKKRKQTQLNFELNFNTKKKCSVEKKAHEAVNDLNKKINKDSKKNMKMKKRC